MRSFPGANTKFKEDYKKPSTIDEPGRFILHVGTNDLNSELSSESITESMVNLAVYLKTIERCISFIILRTDNPHLNEKGSEVNAHIKELYEEKNIYLIDNTKKIKSHHLNKGKVHLNRKGSKLLNDIFVKLISGVLK